MNASPPASPVSDSSPTDSATVPPVDKSGDRVREMFRQIAPRYDAMNHLLSLNTDRYWRRQAVRRLRLVPDGEVLDTCTGTGDLALAVAKKLSGGRVIGTDFCHAMLEIARGKSDRQIDGTDVQFLEADSQSLPFPENRFDCVTVAFGLRNVADTDRGLAEMRRVCKPGGQVMILEFSRPTAWGLRHVYGYYFSHVLPKVGQWFARNDKSAYNYLPESVTQFPDGQALADRMTQAGLIDVQFTPLTFGVATIYEGTKPNSSSKSK